MSKAIQKRRSDELIRILEDVAIDDARVSKAARKGLSLSRAQLFEVEAMKEGIAKNEAIEAMGFETREEFETAVEARRPRSEASYVIQMAHERTGMRIRQSVEQAPKSLNVAIMLPAGQQVTDEQARRAPVIDVEPGGDR